MQQYFVDKSIQTGEIITLDSDVLYHLVKVLRKDDKYIFRVVDSNGKVFHAHLTHNKECEILDFLDENNELNCDITCILSLIKNDKFELTIQKLVELGVKRIVPYKAKRSVVKIKDDKKIDRIKKIVKEASEQSHRNFIPEVCPFADIDDLKKYMSDCNYICYESENNLSEIETCKSISYIIGPEGGFDNNEYTDICNLGFKSISLGRRILRAETAAIYVTSVIVGKNQ